ncbi:MAG: hypothetical protein K8I60_13015, partial [Anaerolineae bacterium]|nr:hypothetical protein [Anaerolineae bacterium]
MSMMACKRIVFVVVVVLLLASTVSAGGPPWTAWLYAPDNGHVVMVGSDSTVIYDFVLPLPQGFDGLPLNVAVSRGGTLLAYLARNSDTQEHQLRVYDVVGQNARVTYNLPPLMGDSFAFEASELNFNPSDSALAYGYTLNDGSWEIVVLDTFLGDVLYQLRSDNPALAGLSGNESGVTPVIQQFDDNSVVFLLPAAPSPSAYRWSLQDGTVTHAGQYAVLHDLDVFMPTGEIVTALDHPDLPGPSLQVYDPTSQTRFPYYNVPEVLEAPHFLRTPRFIQNGERVAVVAG